MNRSAYFTYIEEKLSALATRLEVRGKLNILDLHLHSEDFYKDLFNLLFNLKLQNQNQFKQNAEGIDLVDHTNRIIVQVSATSTKTKIENTLSKDLSSFAGYSFRFISISKDAGKLRDESFQNPHKLTFNPKTDIYDVPAILREVLALDVDHQKDLYEFIRKELGSNIDQMRIESSLASIIKILSLEDLNHGQSLLQTTAFEIDQKIIYNQLNAAKQIVDDYKIHHARIERIYSEFNKMGANKSSAVLQSIRKEYLLHKVALSADALFFKVVEQVMARVQASANYVSMPLEELELCVHIIVVDAFIRCKIFENPLEGTHATP